MRDVLMLLHNMASFLCALFSVYPFLQYYGLFFFGCPEITSVPLSFISMTRSFPFLKDNNPFLYEICKWSFGVLFLLVRLVMWTYVSFFFWIDIWHLIIGERSAFAVCSRLLLLREHSICPACNISGVIRLSCKWLDLAKLRKMAIRTRVNSVVYMCSFLCYTW